MTLSTLPRRPGTYLSRMSSVMSRCSHASRSFLRHSRSTFSRELYSSYAGGLVCRRKLREACEQRDKAELMRDKYVPGRRGNVDKVIHQGAGRQGDLLEEAACVATGCQGTCPRDHYDESARIREELSSQKHILQSSLIVVWHYPLDHSVT